MLNSRPDELIGVCRFVEEPGFERRARDAEEMGAPDVARYDTWADERSWAETNALLAKRPGA